MYYHILVTVYSLISLNSFLFQMLQILGGEKSKIFRHSDFLSLHLWRIDLPPTHKPPPPYCARAPAVPLGVHASQVAWLCQVNPHCFSHNRFNVPSVHLGTWWFITDWSTHHKTNIWLANDEHWVTTGSNKQPGCWPTSLSVFIKQSALMAVLI